MKQNLQEVKRLQELAGILLKENDQRPDKATMDRWYDRIQTEYLDNNPEAEDLQPEEFNRRCQEHMREWMYVRDEYNNNIEDYLEDLTERGDWA